MDSFDQAGLSASNFFNGLGLSPQPALQIGPRKYKSRKERPCDFCRRRQVSCKIDVAPPCQLCQNHGRECTFVERPKKKRRPNNLVGDSGNVTVLGEFALELGASLSEGTLRVPVRLHNGPFLTTGIRCDFC
jgi:hypothetical protein